MRNLLLAVAASGIIRNAHYVTPNGKTIPERTLLVEGGTTNLCLRSQEFDNASWTKPATLTVTANAALAPDGTLTADLIANDGTVSSQGMSQLIAFTANGEKCWGVHLKAFTAAITSLSVYDSTALVHRHQVQVTWIGGVPSLTTVDGSGTRFPPVALKDGWYWLAISATGVVAANINIAVVYPTGGGAAAGAVYAWGAQATNDKFPASYVATTSAPVTRAADAISLPHTRAPQAGTLYVRFIELGMASYGSSQGVVALGASTNPSLMVLTGGAGGYYAINRQAVDRASGPPAGTPAIGDVVELRLEISDTGVLTLGQSLNGAAETVGTPSTAQALPAAYYVPQIQIGSRGAGTEGHFAFTHGPVFVAGAQSMATMRQVAGVR